MLYTICVRNTSDTTVDICVEAGNVVSVCSLLEDSSSVKSYKVCSAGGEGIDKRTFGGGEFKKWFKTNFGRD